MAGSQSPVAFDRAMARSSSPIARCSEPATGREEGASKSAMSAKSARLVPIAAPSEGEVASAASPLAMSPVAAAAAPESVATDAMLSAGCDLEGLVGWGLAERGCNSTRLDEIGWGLAERGCNSTKLDETERPASA